MAFAVFMLIPLPTPIINLLVIITNRLDGRPPRTASPWQRACCIAAILSQVAMLVTQLAEDIAFLAAPPDGPYVNKFDARPSYLSLCTAVHAMLALGFAMEYPRPTWPFYLFTWPLEFLVEGFVKFLDNFRIGTDPDPPFFDRIHPFQAQMAFIRIWLLGGSFVVGVLVSIAHAVARMQGNWDNSRSGREPLLRRATAEPEEAGAQSAADVASTTQHTD